MGDVNYVNVVPMTKEEQIAMYMKLSKKELAEMLYNANEVINNFIATKVSDSGSTGTKALENVPEAIAPTCKSWGDCMNPFMDCINCPLRWSHRDSVTNSNYKTV